MRDEIEDDFAMTQEQAQIFIDLKSGEEGQGGSTQRRRQEVSLTIHVDEGDEFESDDEK